MGIGQNSLDRVWLAGSSDDPARGVEATGGQVATAVLALARLGLRCAYVGAIGADPEGERVLEPLLRAGVDCSRVRRVLGGQTRRALIRVEPESGERTVEPERDPAVRLRPADLDSGQIESARALLIDVEDPEASLRAAELANAAELPVVLDADRRGGGLDALLPAVDFAVVSHELAASFGDGSLRDALRELAARCRRLAVMTLGGGGAAAMARDGETLLESPAFEVEVRDTTGAGDVFHAGFLWGLLQGWDAEAVLRTANAAAALSCRGLGAQGGLPDSEQLAAFLGTSG